MPRIYLRVENETMNKVLDRRVLSSFWSGINNDFTLSSVLTARPERRFGVNFISLTALTAFSYNAGSPDTARAETIFPLSSNNTLTTTVLGSVEVVAFVTVILGPQGRRGGFDFCLEDFLTWPHFALVAGFFLLFVAADVCPKAQSQPKARRNNDKVISDFVETQSVILINPPRTSQSNDYSDQPLLTVEACPAGL
jgi:hypothetical protein